MLPNERGGYVDQALPRELNPSSTSTIRMDLGGGGGAGSGQMIPEPGTARGHLQREIVRSLSEYRLRRCRASRIYLFYCAIASILSFGIGAWYLAKLGVYGRSWFRERQFLTDSPHLELLVEETVEGMISAFFIAETLGFICFVAGGDFRLYCELDKPTNLGDLCIASACALSIVYAVSTVWSWDQEANTVVPRNIFFLFIENFLSLPVLLLRLVLLPARFVMLFLRLKTARSIRQSIAASPVDFTGIMSPRAASSNVQIFSENNSYNKSNTNNTDYNRSAFTRPRTGDGAGTEAKVGPCSTSLFWRKYDGNKSGAASAVYEGRGTTTSTFAVASINFDSSSSGKGKEGRGLVSSSLLSNNGLQPENGNYSYRATSNYSRSRNTTAPESREQMALVDEDTGSILRLSAGDGAAPIPGISDSSSASSSFSSVPEVAEDVAQEESNKRTAASNHRTPFLNSVLTRGLQGP
ncbi:unnamed protein product [Amoebophrya sp. A25]|nr:unnamed protein product [Amoebophrya sp. A25]|eukprot:GSA25T00004557001.1